MRLLFKRFVGGRLSNGRSVHEGDEREEREREDFDFAVPPAASAWGCRAIFRPRWLDAAVFG